MWAVLSLSSCSGNRCSSHAADVSTNCAVRCFPFHAHSTMTIMYEQSRLISRWSGGIQSAPVRPSCRPSHVPGPRSVSPFSTYEAHPNMARGTTGESAQTALCTYMQACSRGHPCASMAMCHAADTVMSDGETSTRNQSAAAAAAASAALSAAPSACLCSEYVCS